MSKSNHLEEFLKFCHQYDPLPLVNVIDKLEGIPSVVVDNQKRLYDLLTHLVVDHGYRRMAFITGPEYNLEANQRYQQPRLSTSRSRLPVLRSEPSFYLSWHTL